MAEKVSIEYYGIRHHGPGSARNLVIALEALRPDAILVELPAEASRVLPFAGHTQLLPPVALLIFDANDRQRAAFLPFAEFSPEWQAIQYAIRHKIPVIPMDLPYAKMSAISDDERKKSAGERQGGVDPRDPLKTLAIMSGMEDGEQWWDRYMESGILGAPVFESVAEIMTSLREAAGPDSCSNELREAWMRNTIRDAISSGKKRLAVVAGAWHIPALKKDADPKKDHDLLEGLADSGDWRSTWIPWSYRRLARSSGYGAGVEAPAWYDILFREEDPVNHWMIRAARLLREEGKMSSTAEVVEARNLADTLAQFHEQPVPGLPELLDAVRTVMADGEDIWLERIRDRLVIGQQSGRVPMDLPDNPLRKDLETELKACRLFSAWEKREDLEKQLDLRKPQGLRTSRLLHRLLLLDINWGTEIPSETGTTGSFSEAWSLRWHEELEQGVVQAGMYGSSIEEACTRFLLEKGSGSRSVSVLADLLERSIKAGLGDISDAFFGLYQTALAAEDQVLQLVTAYVRLVSTERYGSVRDVDREALRRSLAATFPRIRAGLGEGLRHVPDDEADSAWMLVREMLQLATLREEEDMEGLYSGLTSLPGDQVVAPYMAGAVSARLFAEGKTGSEEVFRWLSFRLSDHDRPEHAARFVEGFLSGAGAHLWKDPRWLHGLDRYLGGLPEATFEQILPVLRRAFSGFSASDRQRVLRLISQPVSEKVEVSGTSRFDPERMRGLLIVLGPDGLAAEKRKKE